jgi:hypothetical protein
MNHIRTPEDCPLLPQPFLPLLLLLLSFLQHLCPRVIV